MNTTIDALVQILAVERTAINDSDAWTEIKTIARAALAQARAEQAAAPVPKLEPCATCESLARAVMLDQTGRA